MFLTELESERFHWIHSLTIWTSLIWWKEKKLSTPIMTSTGRVRSGAMTYFFSMSSWINFLSSVFTELKSENEEYMYQSMEYLVKHIKQQKPVYIPWKHTNLFDINKRKSLDIYTQIFMFIKTLIVQLIRYPKLTSIS